MISPEKFDSLCTFTMTSNQRNAAANAVLELVVNQQRDLERFAPSTPEYADLERGLKSLRDLQCTLQCFYKLGPHAFTLEAEAITGGVLDEFCLEESGHE